MNQKTTQDTNARIEGIICSSPLYSMAHAICTPQRDETHDGSAVSLSTDQIVDILEGVSQAGIFADNPDERRLAQELTVGILDEYELIDLLRQHVKTEAAPEPTPAD